MNADPQLPDTHTPSPSPARPLRAVCFDLFHTLVDMRHVPAGTSTPEILGIDPEVWSHKVMEESPHHALGSERDPVESVRRIAHAIDPAIPLERIREAAARRPERFRAALLHVHPDILAALEQIRAAGLRTGLISNAGLDEVAAWDESPLAPLFDATLFSCHEGVMKPDPAIYLRAAARLGTPAAECLFVGDGASREHEGAHAAGMRTVLFLGILEVISPATAARRPRTADHVAHTLAELLTLIERLRHSGPR